MAPQIADNEGHLLSELTRVKCLFQLRAITAALGLDPSHNPPRQIPKPKPGRVEGAGEVGAVHETGDIHVRP